MKMVPHVALCGVVSLVALGAVLCTGCQHSTTATTPISSDQRSQAVAKLREVMHTQQKWVKVHAAESLLALGYAQGVLDEFKKELAGHGDEVEYRIGIWRVLANATRHDHQQSEWVDRLKGVYRDKTSPDRIHAAESLAKLRASLTSDELAVVAEDSASDDARLRAFCCWILAAVDEKNRDRHLDSLIQLLETPNVESRSIAAYSLRFLSPLDHTRWAKVVELAKHEADPFIKLRVYGAALVVPPPDTSPSDLDELRDSLIEAASVSESRFSYELMSVLADAATLNELNLLATFLNGESPNDHATESSSATADVSAAAANAILRLERRNNRQSIHWFDWLVIAVYGIGMICIGFYYAYRNNDSNDYLLGGRSMKPWMIGLSLFATIISTISYLAYPGELISNGPLFLGSGLALPIIYVAVGWWLIPALMNASGTSGYALLEERLGVKVRLLGASVFLLLRFIWMATIIYATATVALLPALDISESYMPVVCIALGCVTLCYTAMGGLRAVVMTDVIQSFLLFGGAIVAVILITVHFGGLDWIPASWPSHWERPSWALGFQGRITITNSMIWMLAWYICTCGSDQMAIQRFKATRDIAAARRSFGVTLVASFLVKVILGIVGLAVMAYFLDQPHLLPDQATVLSDADRLFPSYIVVGIPVGLTGLVISGLMAAAMSSLSSGISASASVISDDFIKRFRGLPASEQATLSQERWISAIVGVVVVILSLGVQYVPGNLFEITSRVVNALVAPLFVLFFLAIFVRWATPFGAVCGLLVSVAVAVAIALFQVMSISMMWIVPASMVAGILAGLLASLIPTAKFR